MGLIDRLKTRLFDEDEARLRRETHARWRALPAIERRVQRVLGLDPQAVGLDAGKDDERGLPGNAEFMKSGWTDHMLLRYFLAMDRAAGRRVLDTCCGLGWGAHLVAGVAQELVGIDLDADAVRFCRHTWGDDNTRYHEGSVLDLPFEADSFDVVLCMEAIEHFSLADGRRYLAELHRVCAPGGVLLGSSTFPDTREQASALCAQNEHHLYIYTRREMRRLLTEVFARPERLTLHYFSAVKRAAR